MRVLSFVHREQVVGSGEDWEHVRGSGAREGGGSVESESCVWEGGGS